MTSLASFPLPVNVPVSSTCFSLDKAPPPPRVFSFWGVGLSCLLATTKPLPRVPTFPPTSEQEPSNCLLCAVFILPRLPRPQGLPKNTIFYVLQTCRFWGCILSSLYGPSSLQFPPVKVDFQIPFRFEIIFKTGAPFSGVSSPTSSPYSLVPPFPEL